jgi:hypothetical protein
MQKDTSVMRCNTNLKVNFMWPKNSVLRVTNTHGPESAELQL